MHKNIVWYHWNRHMATQLVNTADNGQHQRLLTVSNYNNLLLSYLLGHQTYSKVSDQ